MSADKSTSVKEKIKQAIPGLSDDGSKELAAQYLLTLEEAEEMEGLLNNKTFASVLGKMKMDMRSRIMDLIKSDPELAAMKRMFDRTIGLKGAEARIEAVIDEIIETPEMG